MGVLKVVSVEPRTDHPCKVRVKFSEAPNAAMAIDTANYAFTPAVTIESAEMVSATEVDLQLGVELAADASIVAHWRLDEPAWGNGGRANVTVNATAITSNGTTLSCTAAGHPYVAGQLVELQADVWDTDAPTPHIIATAGIGTVTGVVAGVSFSVRGVANGHASGNPGTGDFKDHWCLDESASQYDLTLRDAVAFGGTNTLKQLYGGLHGESSSYGSFYFPGSSNPGSSRLYGPATLGPRASILGEWTVDAIVKWNPSVAGDSPGYIFTYGGVNDATQDDNMLVAIGVLDTGRIYVFWEYSTGTAVTYTTPTDVMVRRDQWCLLTVKKVSVAGGYQVQVFIDGIKRAASGPLANADGGDGPAMRLGIGIWANPELYAFAGYIDTVRLSSTLRSDADILAYAKTSLAGVLQADVTSLQVSNVEDDAGGTPITAQNGLSGVTAVSGGSRITPSAPSVGPGMVSTGSLNPGAGPPSGFNQGVN